VELQWIAEQIDGGDESICKAFLDKSEQATPAFLTFREKINRLVSLKWNITIVD